MLRTSHRLCALGFSLTVAQMHPAPQGETASLYQRVSAMEYPASTGRLGVLGIMLQSQLRASQDSPFCKCSHSQLELWSPILDSRASPWWNLLVCLPPGPGKPGLFVISIVSYIIDPGWLFGMSDTPIWIHAGIFTLIAWLQGGFVDPFL